jgi:hypothetical protein
MNLFYSKIKANAWNDLYMLAGGSTQTELFFIFGVETREILNDQWILAFFPVSLPDQKTNGSTHRAQDRVDTQVDPYTYVNTHPRSFQVHFPEEQDADEKVKS